MIVQKGKWQQTNPLSNYARGKKWKLTICDGQLDEAIEQRDLATKQRDEAQTKIPDIMMKASVDHVYIFLIF